MSFVRTLLVVGGAVLLLPREPEQQARLMAQTGAALHWTVTFCDRNGETCTKAREIWSDLLVKGEFAIALAGKTINDWNTAEPRPGGLGSIAGSRPVDHGTLSTADRVPTWRGQSRPRG